ncbi:gliding motility-associated C-terminal domain-containing protein [Spirosoma soli]|uniref:Gliding motility-associated C-terminal domain-containing protein n=1 Tax=Spirosoma soli TaxID=1770529 RepID=A0ABW5M2G7_9BACT
MRKQLLNKFIGNYGYVLVWLLATSPLMAGVRPVADTCQSPAPPIINGSAKAICRNEAVVLTATGCTGTVVWSNGEVGSTITVHPQQTTKYTAICRAQPGCISCFADVWKVTVNTPNAPVVTASAKLSCPNEAVTLTAANCAGTVRWTNSAGVNEIVGANWTGKLEATTTFQATCEQNNCISNPSIAIAVQAVLPTKPIVTVSKHEICAGQTLQLTASSCIGTVRWSDGTEGSTRSVTPTQTVTYKAVCQIGSCQSDSSDAASVVVRSLGQTPNVLTTVTNGCPFQTGDLSKAVTSNSNGTLNAHYTFRAGPSLDSPQVQSPGAVLAGTYYVFGRDDKGCYTNPVAITVTINSCPNAIAPCLSNPATVAVRLDSLDWSKGIVRLKGQLGGSATQADWQSSGRGLFTDTGLKARYMLSETDRQRGEAVFTLTTPDPDGNGPCIGASSQLVVQAPVLSREVIGLSKKVNEPVWVSEGNNKLVELTYQLGVVNLGKHALTSVQLSDNLGAAFSIAGAQVRNVTCRADSNLTINPAYTGRGADTTLLLTGNLTVGGRSQVWLTVRLDVSQANTLTFSNKAQAQAIDVNGSLCRDRSTNGIDADPDQNGDPADNEEPTLVTLHSLRPETAETVFIPEGFSPNNDGVNDRFIIQQLPANITVQLEVYNRWGHLVYRNNEYKNDWDGTSNQGMKATDAKQGLPDGTYYYQIRLSDGREFVRFLTLAR